MTQIFPRGSNSIVKLVLWGIVVLVLVACAVMYMVTWSTWSTNEQVAKLQPVPFSHRHHVQGAGLDCRYCHTGVEKSAFAGLPSTKTCMTCHSQLFAQSAMLAPVRESYEKNIPLRWNRVQKLPDFVYFRHDIHVAKGVSCETCHGHVEKMALTAEHRVFHMRECLECHRAPERYLRPRDQVFNMQYAAKNQLELGRKLVKEYGINKAVLTSCSTCHR